MAVEIEEEMDTPKTARLQESLSSKEGQAYPELDLAALAKETPEVQKQIVGEKIHACCLMFVPSAVEKITSMMLEMGTSDLLKMLASKEQLVTKVDEAMVALANSTEEGTPEGTEVPAEAEPDFDVDILDPKELEETN